MTPRSFADSVRALDATTMTPSPAWALTPEVALLAAVLEDAKAVLTAPTAGESEAMWWRDLVWILDLCPVAQHRFAFLTVCAHLRLDPEWTQRCILGAIPRAVARRFAKVHPQTVTGWREVALAHKANGGD